MLPYLDVLLQYVGEESGKKKYFEKSIIKTIHEEKYNDLLHLLGKKKNVFG